MFALVLASAGGVGWYALGVAGFLLWAVLLIFFGIKTLRRGHWVMFLLGFVIPICWVIGAFLSPRR